MFRGCFCVHFPKSSYTRIPVQNIVTTTTSSIVFFLVYKPPQKPPCMLYIIVLAVFIVLFYCTPSEDSVLRDLKALLLEAKQKVPPFLLELDSLSADMLELGGEINYRLRTMTFRRVL